MSDLILADPLSESERHRLGELESTIRHGLQSFIEAGQALTEVRDSRLYRETFSSFEDYCRGQWNISRPRAYELMAGADAVSGIPDTLPAPSNAGQAVELARVPEQKRTEVWRRAVENTSGKPTAAAVRQAREQVAPRPALAPRPPTPQNDQPAATPIPGESPLFGEAEIVDAEIVDDPPPPAEPSPDETAARALRSFIEADPAQHVAAWRTSFIAAIARTTSIIPSFKPEAVAENADESLIKELRDAHRHLGNYIDRINAQRPAGLRLVRRG